jgi:integrase
LEYKQDKISATQWDNYKNLVDIVLTQYSGLPAHEFSPNKLRTLRVEFVKRGYVRQQCNKRAGHVRSIFKWGVSHELIAADIWNALRSLEYIKKGETIAPEGKKRRAIPLEHIERTLAELSPTLAAMARIHLATAARPSEICLMRIENIDRTEFLFAISDYAPFLDEGYPALYFTDTAEYRNKHYHEKTDTWDKLDYDRLTQVSVGMYRIIQAIDAAHAPK